jgi:hypothetical protein
MPPDPPSDPLLDGWRVEKLADKRSHRLSIALNLRREGLYIWPEAAGKNYGRRKGTDQSRAIGAPVSADAAGDSCHSKRGSDVRTLCLQTIDFTRRIERRIGEQRDDLELMIRAELSGSLANMQTQLENHLQPIEDKLNGFDRLEERVGVLGTRCE